MSRRIPFDRSDVRFNSDKTYYEDEKVSQLVEEHMARDPRTIVSDYLQPRYTVSLIRLDKDDVGFQELTTLTGWQRWPNLMEFTSNDTGVVMKDLDGNVCVFILTWRDEHMSKKWLVIENVFIHPTFTDYDLLSSLFARLQQWMDKEAKVQIDVMLSICTVVAQFVEAANHILTDKFYTDMGFVYLAGDHGYVLESSWSESSKNRRPNDEKDDNSYKRIRTSGRRHTVMTSGHIPFDRSSVRFDTDTAYYEDDKKKRRIRVDPRVRGRNKKVAVTAASAPPLLVADLQPSTQRLSPARQGQSR